MNTVEKYWWVRNHPLYNKILGYGCTIEIEPHMVCKDTNRIEDDESKNTTLQYWIELFYFEKRSKEEAKLYKSNEPDCVHDWEVDCGGYTVEEAIDKLYDLVLEKKGNYDVT